MKYAMTLLTICLIMVALTGCKESGTTTGGLYGFESISTGSGASGSGNVGGGAHLPEPTTMALLGSGLLAYAFFRRKKDKK